MNRRLFVLALLIAPGCASPRPPVLVSRPEAVREELEPIEVVSLDQTAITIRVKSNGCAQKAHFTSYVDRTAGTPSLAFARSIITSCRAPQTFQADLTFTWPEIGLRPNERFVLLNPLLGRTGPGS